MDPERTAFLTTVLRYLTLRYNPRTAEDAEYDRCKSALADPPLGTLRPNWQQRSFKRLEFEGLRGLARINELDSPIEVLDLSGSGLRMRDEGGLGEAMQPGKKVMISLEPPRSQLRIDLPAEIVHHDEETDTHGVRFLGAPLVLQRHPSRARKPSAPPPDDRDPISALPVVTEIGGAPANDSAYVVKVA